MRSRSWMFDCCRIPGSHGADWSHSYARPEDTGLEGHIIVLRSNGVWKVDIARDGRLLSTDELEKSGLPVDFALMPS